MGGRWEMLLLLRAWIHLTLVVQVRHVQVCMESSSHCRGGPLPPHLALSILVLDQITPPCGRKIFHAWVAAICWSLWIARNGVCFEKKMIRSPAEIIWSACSFLSYWAGLQKEEDRDQLEEGATALKNAALSFHPQEDGGLTGVKLLQSAWSSPGHRIARLLFLFWALVLVFSQTSAWWFILFWGADAGPGLAYLWLVVVYLSAFLNRNPVVL